MSIFPKIIRGWRRFLSTFVASSYPHTLMEDMSDAYRTELALATLCTQHAQRMYYPQFRTELLRIAAETETHLPWLREQILALGGSLPSASPMLASEGNSWECFSRDIEEARLGSIRVLDSIHRAEREQPAIAAGLQRIRKDKLRHREEFRHMLMKSDPYTIPAAPPLQAHEEQQKQTWIEQRKNEWLNQERASWHAGGKQTPWAQWSGEQEFKWTSELPHHEREWAQHLTESRK